MELNRFSEAETAFHAALQAFEDAGVGRACAIVEGNLGDLMSRQGRLDRALYHYERARRKFEADQAAGDLARLEAEQAEALAGAGLLTQAAESYSVALPELGEHPRKGATNELHTTTFLGLVHGLERTGEVTTPRTVVTDLECSLPVDRKSVPPGVGNVGAPDRETPALEGPRIRGAKLYDRLSGGPQELRQVR